MKILIIDNNIDPEFWGAQDICRVARKVQGTALFVRRAPAGDLPKSPKGFDRVIVSGSKTSALDDSPWVIQLIDFIKQTLELKKPYLGICFGHQILARAVGGKELISKAAKPEFGWTQIRLTAHKQPSPPNPLTQGLPESFYSYSAHYEEVNQLPKGMKAFASSDLCKIQGYYHEQLPFFGLQFHPEKSFQDGKSDLANRRKKKEPAQLLNPNLTEDLYNPNLGETIFRNFMQIGNSK